ncbi:MAG: hypothetical protein LBI49_11155 [Nocardiopsaceae bacterium]|jgi:expansin (peptidoglycan-binding protein)|nr:hypothetical protein [Nocardiopsaceae bacterium]
MRQESLIPGRGNRIWLLSAAATIAAVTGTAVSLGLLAPPRCARGAPAASAVSSPSGGSARTPRVISGHANFYDPGTVAGSCSLGPFRPGGRYAALPRGQYAGGAACGTYLEVRGPSGTTRVEAVDLCPACSATTLNLSRAAFLRIGDPSSGMIDVSYHRVANPVLPGPLLLRVADVGTPGMLVVQVRNTGNGLAAVSVGVPPAGPAGGDASGGGARVIAWHRMTLNRNDYWLARRIYHHGPFALRITDIQGHQVVLPQVRLLPGTVVRTATWLYRGTRRAGSRPAPATSAASAAGC